MSYPERVFNKGSLEQIVLAMCIVNINFAVFFIDKNELI